MVRRHSFYILSFTLLTLFIGCTNRNSTGEDNSRTGLSSDLPAQSATQVAEIRYQGNDIDVWNMIVDNNTLYFTASGTGGKIGPGFAGANIVADPELPTLNFAVGSQTNNLLNQWIAPLYARGAIAINNNLALTSGTAGMSAYDLTQSAKEIFRVPTPPPTGSETLNITGDAAYVWSTAVFHPAAPVLYAFKSQEYAMTYLVTSSGLQLLGKENYSPNGKPVCCATSSVIFNNAIFVAFSSELRVYQTDTNGRLYRVNSDSEMLQLQAAWVTASPNYLYVLHKPNNSATGRKDPSGVYVFNRDFQQVGYIPMSPVPQMIAAHPQDTHFYAKFNNAAISILRRSGSFDDEVGYSGSAIKSPRKR